MTASRALIWLRNDLRLDDNPALTAAASSGRPLICLFILDEANAGPLSMGSAQKWWLHHSLGELAKSIKKVGGRLILKRGKATDILPDIVRQHQIDQVFWTRRYMSWQITVDRHLKALFRRPASTC